MNNKYTYHPDKEINTAIEQEMIKSERIDMAAGYPPRWWKCPECGSTHNRGHFLVLGRHRCLKCGYDGVGGVMAETKQELIDNAEDSNGSTTSAVIEQVK